VIGIDGALARSAGELAELHALTLSVTVRTSVKHGDGGKVLEISVASDPEAP
jgi:hypothetical protein